MSPYTGPSYSAHVQYFIDPAHISQFLASFQPLWDLITAEPECVFFEVYQNPEVPGHFKFMENWNASREYLETVQMQKEYYNKAREDIKDLMLKPPVIEIWERDPGSQFLYVGGDMTERKA